uniref:Uncharacterized protein n=1 Tax=Rhizophora mucronata TaxID=61149 RepID=A0A2P2LHV6_RHIMU
MAESSGTTLMDLITADPGTLPSATSGSTAAPPASTATPSSSSGKSSLLGEKKSKRGTLTFTQIQNDTISAAKAALNPVKTNIMPQRQKKKPVSYSQLARSIHELAATSDQVSTARFFFLLHFLVNLFVSL